jgi:hypothetical protein
MSDVYYLQGSASRGSQHVDPPWWLHGIGPPPTTVRLTETPLVGYRLWWLLRSRDPSGGWWRRRDIKLVSPATYTTWDGPVLRADERPRWTLRGSGVYACDPSMIRRLARLALRRPGEAALGEVQGMGRCVVHERGWRAGVVRVTSLYVAAAVSGPDRKRLRTRYHCDVRDLETLIL